MPGTCRLAWADPLCSAIGTPRPSVKWVDQITVQQDPSDNYFQARAYRLLPAEAGLGKAGPGDGLSLGAVAVNADILRPDGHPTVINPNWRP